MLCAMVLLIHFSIPQHGSLSDQILEWSQQAQQPITWKVEEIPARHGVQGAYTLEEAMCQLLKDSGAEYIKDGTEHFVRTKGEKGPDPDEFEDYCDPPPKTIHLKAIPAGTSIAKVLDTIRFNPANHVSIRFLFLSSPPDYTLPPTHATIPAGDYTVRDALCAVLAFSMFTFDFEKPRTSVKVYPERGTDTLSAECAPLVWDTPEDIHVPVADWN
jgi:hypothetical protein